jgi:hypothetical protein
LRGDIDAGPLGCRYRLVIESPESREDVAELVRLAKQGCFAEQTLLRPVAIESTVVVNGTELSPEQLAPVRKT